MLEVLFYLVHFNPLASSFSKGAKDVLQYVHTCLILGYCHHISYKKNVYLGMSKEMEQILTLAKKLSRSEQMFAIQAIAALVQWEDEQMDIPENWQEEIRRRIQLLDQGNMSSRPWREVMQEIRNAS